MQPSFRDTGETPMLPSARRHAAPKARRGVFPSRNIHNPEQRLEPSLTREGRGEQRLEPSLTRGREEGSKGWSLRLRGGGKRGAKAGAFAYAGRERGEQRLEPSLTRGGKEGSKGWSLRLRGLAKKIGGHVLPYPSVGDWPDGYF